MVLALPMLQPLSAAATSPSAVNNNQVQLGDVFATQTLNVVTTTDSTTETTSTTGNGVTSAVVSGSLDVQSHQVMSGASSAKASTNVTTDAGAQTVVSTSAVGNTSEADSLGGGTLTGNFTQVVNPATSNCAAVAPATPVGCIKSENDFNAAAAQTGAASVSSQAIANSMDFAVTGGSSNVTTNQSNSANVDAESGSDTTGGATLQYSGGTLAFSAIGVSNNLTATGTSGAAQTINATQATTGATTTAGQFVDVGNGQTIQGAAAATANNISVSNASADLNVTDHQTNASYTQADSVATGFEFGSGQATADGVGNSMMAANVGPSTELSNTQSNTNGTQATASFTGDTGYDASASATAMANAATAFACSDCGGVITVNNSQSNTGGVGAASTVTITGSNRSVSSTATAVGNNATFYVSKPST
jgi:hypothetical protein